jgi:hypothetical protein
MRLPSSGDRRGLDVPPSLDEVFRFYRGSGFLYPAKLAALEPRLPVIEETWKRLLAADRDVFRFVARRSGADGRVRLTNAACAYEYAPGTWHCQHLVSAERREYAGTLGVLSDLIGWCHDTGADHARASFRPDNPGVNRLFGVVAEGLPTRVVALSVVDYGLVPVDAVTLPYDDAGVAVRPLRRGEERELIAFYSKILSRVELDALRLDDPRFDALDRRYRAHGLTRRRTPLVAVDGARVVGACLVHHASEGMNFSFLENAIEHVRVASDLSTARAQQTWRSLIRAAVTEARRERDYVVVALDPDDRALGVAAGLLPRTPKQYAVLTVSRRERGLLRGIELWEQFYEARRRLATEGVT